MEIVVANSRTQPIRVEISYRLFRSGDFEIEGSSRPISLREEPDGPVATATLSVPTGERAKLTFTVIYRR